MNKATIWLKSMVYAVYAFLYTPIAVLIIYSFNENPYTQTWQSFTFEWYKKLFNTPELQHAFINSFIIATYTTILGLLLGTLFVVYCNEKYSNVLLNLFYSILGIPEVVISVALLNFFSSLRINLGFVTLISAHVLLSLAYIIPILHTRYKEIDKRLLEAAYDLGATHTHAFLTIILPLLLPSILASGLLVFIISLDDFLIAFFCAGPSVQTLPLYIFSTIRAGTTPIINALSTMLFLFSCLCVLLFFILQKHSKKDA
ncbi:MAG TPA: ABC transporter permease [Patescibacteria group bacterium]|jgi:spermidine/putrescine transport system permease protein|nr:ABC transporter permease [Patescibacteria group bacterium]